MSIASWIASANLSWRSVTNATGSREHMATELRALRKRALLRECDGIVDLRGNGGFDRGMEGVVHNAIILQQPAVQPDRTTSKPEVKLLLSTIAEMDVAERAAMLEPSIGDELEQRGAAALANMSYGLSGYL